jgi:hypothetical protein
MKKKIEILSKGKKVQDVASAAACCSGMPSAAK